MIPLLIGLAAAALLALSPFFFDAYGVGVIIGLLGYATLASAWAMFSGPTRYISLATVAFFGVGAYTVAVLSEVLPWPLVLLCAALVGAALALAVGLSTLRVAGIYFVIFSFGLAELIRQLITWYEVNVTGTLGVTLPAAGAAACALAIAGAGCRHSSAGDPDRPQQARTGAEGNR